MPEGGLRESPDEYQKSSRSVKLTIIHLLSIIEWYPKPSHLEPVEGLVRVNRREPGIPCKFYNMQKAPKAYQVRKVVSLVALKQSRQEKIKQLPAFRLTQHS
jgi:hypothetical protein